MVYYGEANAHLGAGEGVVYWIVSQASSSDWEVRIRDGSDTDAVTIFRASWKAEGSPLYRFDPPLPFSRGLYVQKVDDMLSFTIAYGFTRT